MTEVSIYRYNGIKVKFVYLNGCSFEEKLQKILDGQADNKYNIHDIQHVKDIRGDYAWIYYTGDFPNEQQ